MTIATKDIAANGTHPAKVVSLVEIAESCALATQFQVKTRWFKAGTDVVLSSVETFQSASEARNWFDFA